MTVEERTTEIIQKQLGAQLLQIAQLQATVESQAARITDLEARISPWPRLASVST